MNAPFLLRPLLASVLLTGVVSTSVLAITDKDNSRPVSAKESALDETPSPTPITAQKPITRKLDKPARLAANRLQACERREAKINAITVRIVERTERQLGVFDAIAARTKAFYATKGRMLSTYDTLSAAVDSARLKTTADLASMKATSTVSCEGTDPRAVAFKANLKTAQVDLKAYKTAIKNLIVGVKSAEATR